MFYRGVLTILALVGLAFAATDSKHRPACESAKAVVSSASDVYYSGECRWLWWQCELMRV